MQIKSYNRAVDPNTINGQVRAPADINAYGGNVSGQRTMMEGLDAVSKQWQAYVDDQINMSVIEASNKYQEGLNDLLNNPATGLLTKKDINALDLMQQYQEGEAKIRQESMAGLPNYRKAHDTFTNMANDTNITKMGAVMKYQYARQEEYRNTLCDTKLSQNLDNAVEMGTDANFFDVYNKNSALITSLYGNILGQENLEQKIKNANTDALKAYVKGILADGSQTGVDVARSLLSRSAGFVNDQDLAELTAMITGKTQAADIESRIEEARKRFPGDPEKQKQWIASQNEYDEYRMVSGSGDGVSESYFDANASIESAGSGDYNAYNASSGAFGKYQFLPDTWNWVSEQTGINPEDHSPEAQDKNARWYWDYLKRNLGGNEEATIVAWNWGLDNGKRWMEGKTTGIYDGQEFSFDEPYLGNISVNERIAKARDMVKNSSERRIDEAFQVGEREGLMGISMQNGKNGCAEFVGKFGSRYSQFLQDQMEQGVVYVPTMVQNAIDSKIPVINFNPQELQKGDCIVYTTSEGEDGHIVIYDGNGGYYGNSSSSGPNGMTVHGSDYNIPGMTPQRIIKTGIGTGGTHWVKVRKKRWSLDREQEIYDELDRRDALDKKHQQEMIDAKITQKENEYMDWQLNNPNATDTERRAVLGGLIGDDEDLKHSRLGTTAINLDRSIKAAADSAMAKNNKANVFQMNKLKMRIVKGEITSEEKLSEVMQESGLSYTDEQINSVYTYLGEFQRGKGFDIGDHLNKEALGWDSDTWSKNKAALDVLVGTKVNEYKATHNGLMPTTEEIRGMAVDVTTQIDTGATASYGWFTDEELTLSDADAYRLGFSGYEKEPIKTKEGTYIRFYVIDKNGNKIRIEDVYATEVPNYLKRNGIR